MSSAVGFALLSLLFAGFNDVVFKRYAARERSRGMFLMGIGVVWCAFQAGLLAAQGASPRLDAATLAYGAVAGVVLAASNLMLVESLGHVDVSLGSTIFRLNTIGVAILSVLFLGEALGAGKSGGIALGIVAVLLLARRAAGPRDSPRHGLFVAVVIGASLLRAIYGVVSKAGLSAGADAATMMLMGAIAWIVGGAAYALLRERRFRVTRAKLGYAALGGMLVALNVNALIAAVGRADASRVIPIANLSFVAAMLLSVAMGMESLTGRKVAAIACAVAAIALLAWA